MNAVTPWVIAGLATTAVVGLAWAWWAHRQRLAEMQRRLAWNEESRFELERQTQALDERLATMAQALKTLESVRQQAPPAAPAWPDTEPLCGATAPAATAAANSLTDREDGEPASARAFAQTMPVGLDELGPLPAASQPQARVLPFRR